jgi:hypothetical protein
MFLFPERSVVLAPESKALKGVPKGRRIIRITLRVEQPGGSRTSPTSPRSKRRSDRGDPAVLDGNRSVGTAVSGHPVRAADPEHGVSQIVRRTRRCSHALTSRLALGLGDVSAPSMDLT